MKKVILITLFSFILFSCSENDEMVEETSNDLIENEIKSKSTKVSLFNGTEVGCEGDCNNENKTCVLTVFMYPPYDAECSCAGSCSFFIKSISKARLDFANNEPIEDFSKYIKATYALDKVDVKKISFEEKDGNLLAFFDFYLPNDSTLQTIVWVNPVNNTSTKSFGGGDKIIVDCSGNCDNENETCRERWNASEGTVECTCQGGCKMTITTVKEIQF